MKKLLYTLCLFVIFSGFGEQKAEAQSVFNDTIYFQIFKTRSTTIGAKYLMDFQTAPSVSESFTGKMVLSLCYCYCDSIWDAWPPSPSDSVMTGGKATLSYASSSGSGGAGIFGNDGPYRLRGRLNIWQMPGSFPLTEAFTLPVVFIKN